MNILVVGLSGIADKLSTLFEKCDVMSVLTFVDNADEAQPLMANKYDVALIAYAGINDPNLPIIDELIDRSISVVVMATAVSPDIKALFASKPILDYVVYDSDGSDLHQVAVILSRYNKNRAVTALVVDDTAAYRTQVSYLLTTQGLRVLTANDGIQALEIVKKEPVRIMVTDYEMPNMNGLELTKATRKVRGKDDLAILVFTASENGHAAEFLKMGANDFLTKPFTREELTCRIDQNLDLIYLMDKFRDSANRDFLTSLHNRRYFLKMAGARFNEAQSASTPMAVAMLDIDFFKKINDTHGHEAGDEALRVLSKVLVSSLPSGQLAARLGGEEFALMFTGDEALNVEKTLEDLRVAIEQQPILLVNNLRFHQSVSIGCVLSADMPDTLGRAMMMADKALYEAKHQGRNRVIFADASMLG